MGANAVTTFPTYTTGQVLEAADLNITNCGVPVAADASARDGLFGGTGEKTLAEGQLCYLEDSNIVQYYDGSSWATVGPSAAPGLELITAQTIGSAVSSVTVSSAFSATYENYRIIVAGGAGSTNLNLSLTFGATNTGYYAYEIFGLFNAVTLYGANASNAASFANVGYATTANINTIIEVQTPNLAKTTHVQAVTTDSRTDGGFLWKGGWINNTTQYTAFTLTTSTGTLTGGTVRVYGYKN